MYVEGQGKGVVCALVCVCVSLFLLLSSSEAKVLWVTVYYTHTTLCLSVSQSGSKSHWLSLCMSDWCETHAVDQQVSCCGSPSLLCWETVSETGMMGFIIVCFSAFLVLSPYPSIFPFQFPLLCKLLNKFIRTRIDLS